MQFDKIISFFLILYENVLKKKKETLNCICFEITVTVIFKNIRSLDFCSLL